MLLETPLANNTPTRRTPVSLAGGALGFNWLPVFVAQARGLFDAHGLEVELRRLGSVDKATAAVRSGEANLAISPPEGALSDAVAGGNLRLIAANCNCLPLTLVAHQRFKRIEDLKGAVLGTSSLTEGTAIYTREMLAQHGLEYPRDYSFALAGVHQGRGKALQEGTIDGAVQPPPFNFLAIDAGYSDLGEVSDALSELAAKVSGELVDIRRDLHAHPELARREKRPRKRFLNWFCIWPTISFFAMLSAQVL